MLRDERSQFRALNTGLPTTAVSQRQVQWHKLKKKALCKHWKHYSVVWWTHTVSHSHIRRWTVHFQQAWICINMKEEMHDMFNKFPQGFSCNILKITKYHILHGNSQLTESIAFTRPEHENKTQIQIKRCVGAEEYHRWEWCSFEIKWHRAAQLI